MHPTCTFLLENKLQENVQKSPFRNGEFLILFAVVEQMRLCVCICFKRMSFGDHPTCFTGTFIKKEHSKRINKKSPFLNGDFLVTVAKMQFGSDASLEMLSWMEKG